MPGFFFLPKSDRRILMVLIGIIVVALGVLFIDKPQEKPTALQPAADTVDTGKPRYLRPSYSSGKQQPVERFAFDPNTADSTQLLRLGLQSWQIRNIYRYREAGGVFHKPQDFARLYGLTLKQYRQLEPYIRIAKEYNMMARDYISDEKPAAPQRDSLVRPQKLSPEERVAVNQADTTLLQRVPGIGPYYARRIVSYRQRLGGYYRTEQLLEIEGFPESALGYFSIADDGVVRKLNVNRLSLNELRQHPYMGYYRAKQIVDFRRTHGRISSLNELSLSKDFTPEVIERLEHYVEY
jgi:DNA uptake protein ComE-like DNA-binding protein